MTLLVIVEALLLLLVSPSCAQSSPLIEYQHTAWTEQNGAPSQITAIAQTRDGFLWLGTVNGLFRFDGVKFEAYQLTQGQTFPHLAIQSLTATPDGGLWIGYVNEDTSFLKDGRIKTQIVRTRAHHAGGTVYSIVPRRDGKTWAATMNGPVKLIDGQWQDSDEAVQSGIKTADLLFEDSHRTLWLVTDEFLYRLPIGAKRFEKTGLNGGGNTILAESPDGSVWAADRYGIHVVTDALDAKGKPRFVIPFHSFATGLAFDSAGTMWVATGTMGFSRISGLHKSGDALPVLKNVNKENFESKNGLSSDQSLCSLEDREGNLWVGTAAGLDRFRRTALTPAQLPAKFGFYALAAETDGSILIGTEEDGLQRLMNGHLSRVLTGTEKRITSVYRAPDQKLWLGGTSNLGYFKDGRYTNLPVPKDLQSPPRDTQTMTYGPDGDLWLQTASKLGILRWRSGAWTMGPHPAEKGAAVVMATDQAGRVWAGYMNGIVMVFGKNNTVQTFNQTNGLAIGNVLALCESPNGMWLGGEHGLALVIGNTVKQIRFAAGNAIDGISGVLVLDDGSLWINSQAGVVRVSRHEVDTAVRDSSHLLEYRLFNQLDGISGKAPQLRPLPSIIKGFGSILWFTTTNGAFFVDTAHIPTNFTPPPVSIRDVVVDGTTLDKDGIATLPKGARDLQIDYTALSLSIPERVHFRFKLDGYDTEWRDAGTRRQAFYTHLPPGQYVFHVIACNNDGFWNETGDSVRISLPPTFLQTWAFKTLILTLFFAAVFFLYVLRLRAQAGKIQARTDERLFERDRIARELHDTLFQSVEGGMLLIRSVTSQIPVQQDQMEKLDRTLQEIGRTVEATRNLIFHNGPFPQPFDLSASILALTEQLSLLSGLQYSVLTAGTVRDIRPSVCDEMIKILREGLANATRHAGAKQIQVRIEYTQQALELSVCDDGVGIDPVVLERGGRRGHWGLTGMRQRAESVGGEFRVTRSEEGGTEVCVVVPASRAFHTRISRLWAAWLGWNDRTRYDI